jgi:hypothetical protein
VADHLRYPNRVVTAVYSAVALVYVVSDYPDFHDTIEPNAGADTPLAFYGKPANCGAFRPFPLLLNIQL